MLSVKDVPGAAVRSEGRSVRYTVEVEDGLSIDSGEFVTLVQSVLGDQRGWQTEDDVTFVPVSAQESAAGTHIDIRITLASPVQTARLCAPLNVTFQQVSCWNGGRAVLNLTRWIQGAATYGNDLRSYRIYMVNHEVGHGLGHGHTGCPSPGRPAPIMMQQTKGLDGCTAWPYPTRP